VRHPSSLTRAQHEDVGKDDLEHLLSIKRVAADVNAAAGGPRSAGSAAE
jgi:hypothetical protein